MPPSATWTEHPWTGWGAWSAAVEVTATDDMCGLVRASSRSVFGQSSHAVVELTRWSFIRGRFVTACH